MIQKNNTGRLCQLCDPFRSVSRSLSRLRYRSHHITATDRSTPVVQILSTLVSAFRGSQQPALEENDSHLLLVARACGYRLPRAASMRYLTLTISHGKRVLPYVRGRRVHDGRLRDSPRFAVCATTTRTGQLSTCSRSLMRAGEGQDPRGELSGHS